MNIITRLGWALLLSAVVAVGALWLSGCGDGSWEWLGLGESGGNNNCTSAEKCKSKEMPDGNVWMTENLSIKTADSWCYDNKAVNCTKYGRLYTWDAAMKACPSGWHLASHGEWGTLIWYAGGYSIDSKAGRRLKSKSGWDKHAGINGTDEYGFSALPGGMWDSRTGGDFFHADHDGYWWTSTERVDISTYYIYIGDAHDWVDDEVYNKGNALSVRCIAD